MKLKELKINKLSITLRLISPRKYFSVSGNIFFDEIETSITVKGKKVMGKLSNDVVLKFHPQIKVEHWLQTSFIYGGKKEKKKLQ